MGRHPEGDSRVPKHTNISCHRDFILASPMREFRQDTKSTVLKVGGADPRAELSTLSWVTWTVTKGTLCRSMLEGCLQNKQLFLKGFVLVQVIDRSVWTG